MAYFALSAREKEDLEKLCVKKDQALSRREIKKAGKRRLKSRYHSYNLIIYVGLFYTLL